MTHEQAWLSCLFCMVVVLALRHLTVFGHVVEFLEAEVLVGLALQLRILN